MGGTKYFDCIYALAVENMWLDGNWEWEGNIQFQTAMEWIDGTIISKRASMRREIKAWPLAPSPSF